MGLFYCQLTLGLFNTGKSAQVFIYYGQKYPSICSLWAQVTKCLFMMGTSDQVFVHYGHK